MRYGSSKLEPARSLSVFLFICLSVSRYLCVSYLEVSVHMLLRERAVGLCSRRALHDKHQNEKEKEEPLEGCKHHGVTKV